MTCHYQADSRLVTSGTRHPKRRRGRAATLSNAEQGTRLRQPLLNNAIAGRPTAFQEKWLPGPDSNRRPFD